MKRVFVYRNKLEEDGKLMAVEDTIKDFKKAITAQFQLKQENLKCFSANGCEINDVRVIRDNEKIYLSYECDKMSKNCDTLTKSTDNFNVSEDKDRMVSDWIRLNVGGKHFVTSRSTLLAKEPLSMLARMFADDNNMYLMNPSATDDTGAYLIDRSPEYFEPILNYLRHGNVILDKNINPKGVLEEAVFYGKRRSNVLFKFCSKILFQLEQLKEQS